MSNWTQEDAIVLEIDDRARIVVPTSLSPILDAGPDVDVVLPISEHGAGALATAIRAGVASTLSGVGYSVDQVVVSPDGSLTWSIYDDDSGWLVVDTQATKERVAWTIEEIPTVRALLQERDLDHDARTTRLALRGHAATVTTVRSTGPAEGTAYYRYAVDE